MINDHVDFNGGGYAVFEFEKNMYLSAGYDVYCFSQSRSLEAFEDPKSIVVRESKYGWIRKLGKFFFSVRVYYRLHRLLKELSPDLVNVHLVSKYPAAVYAALGSTPVIQTLHGPNLFCATAWGCIKKTGEMCELGIGLKCYSKKCVSFPVYVLYQISSWVTSHFVRRAVTVFRGPSRQITGIAGALGYAPIEYIPLAVQEVELKPAEQNRSKVVLFVGSIEVHKGVDVLLQAFRSIHAAEPESRLLYVGEGQLVDSLRHQSAMWGLASSVEFLGFVEHSSMSEIYRQADVVAVPSIWSEQFGLVGPEAMAHGVSCVGSNIGGIPEWLHDGEWGYLVPPRDPDALAQKILELLRDDELRRRFGQRGRDFVAREYNSTTCAARVMQLTQRASKNQYSKE